MSHVLIRHKVIDYAAWKRAFDAHQSKRKTCGEKGSRLFHTNGDPNEVLLLCEWESAESARRFVESDELQQAMHRAGVSDQPSVYYLDEM